MAAMMERCRHCGVRGLHGRVEQCLIAVRAAVARARRLYPERAAAYLALPVPEPVRQWRKKRAA